MRFGWRARVLIYGTIVRAKPPGISSTLVRDLHHRFPRLRFSSLEAAENVDQSSWASPISIAFYQKLYFEMLFRVT
jgi:hypothetical protein